MPNITQSEISTRLSISIAHVQYTYKEHIIIALYIVKVHIHVKTGETAVPVHNIVHVVTASWAYACTLSCAHKYI